ncbi:MAG: H(+)-transporting V0 sector ATPase subunit c [Chaenotheca gracillima]|nr:MAG: H(+)-transporting V0 sector ATPase subunit c [Chaenotheca gracillima]
MADVEAAPSFGGELRDGFKPVNTWVANGIAWLEDIQQFYRERSTIEREYSAKLSSLAKRYYEKKSKKSSPLSVGDTPTMTPGSLESASLTTWTTQLQTVEARASEHERFATELISHLAEPLKGLGARYEDIRKRHADYANKLEKERDASYAELRKTKGSYDSVCQEVENRRKKIDSSFDYGKSKAQNAYQQQMIDMHNVKNSYLISINVTNKQKEKYYYEYVPELLDSLQGLSETRVAKLNSLWSTAAKLETGVLTRSTEHLNHLSNEIPRNNPTLDSMMFVRHNGGGWQEPPDMTFEPSPVWHDDDGMIVDDLAKTFLRNIMGRSKAQLGELKRDVDKKQQEVDGVKRVREKIRLGQDSRDEVQVVATLLNMQEELHGIERKRSTAEVETAVIQTAVGDLTVGAKNHNFKSQTFKIPTNCDLCGERIWGLSAKGFDCRDCGYTCHNKCELKVPAECPGEQTKEEKRSLKARRQEGSHAAHPASNGAHPDGIAEAPGLSRSNTMNSLSSGYATSAHRSVSGPSASARSLVEDNGPERGGAAPARPASTSKPPPMRKNRVVAPPPTQYVSELPADERRPEPAKSGAPRGKMIYPYESSGPDEITLDDGKDVVVLEPDDGSGWIKVRAGAREGLVPTAYVEISATPPPADRPVSAYSSSSASVAGSVTTASREKKKGPAVAPKRGAKKLHHVEALYDYEARTESEWSMAEGDRFLLVNRDAGDGWADVERGGVTKSVPANYIQDVAS